jgi:hypothetical protein
VVLAGASCRHPDTPGVFVDSDTQWHLADIPVPVSLVHDTFETLRLATTGNETEGLLAATGGKTTSLVAAWEPTVGRPWVLSPPLPIDAAGDLLASGTGPGSTEFVLERSGSRVTADVIAGPGSPWRELPALPQGTATIAYEPGGPLDALSVNGKHLTVWSLGANGHDWAKSATIVVPIVFGSSD